MNTTILTRESAHWPILLSERLGSNAPTEITVRGNVEILGGPLTALFCSFHTPGDAILRSYDTARRLCDEGVTVIGGFHSPIEKGCLQILLRGEQPIIICPARSISPMHIPSECRDAFDSGRLLFLSPFVGSPVRVTRELAIRRNEFVAALADAAFIAHITPGGHTERLAHVLIEWGVRYR